MRQTFGERLKELRKAANITQSDLADKMNIHPQTVSKWERDLSQPDISQLGELAAVLHITLEKLCGQEETGETFTGNFDAVELGKMIGKERTLKGESQEQLAETMKTSTDTISRWERGVTCPDIERLSSLALHFGISVSRLYCAVSEEQETENVVYVKKRRRISIFLIAAVAILICAVVVMSVMFSRPSVHTYMITIDGQEIAVNENEWFTPQSPVREGYDFVGWEDESGARITFPRKISENAAFIAVFTPHKYVLDYWLNGGFFEEVAQREFTVESGVLELPVPEKSGQTFVGWYLTADYSGDPVERIACEGKDIKLYAKWSDTAYTVVYELGGGILYGENPVTVTKDEMHTLVEPVRAGYIFLGWYDQPQGGNKIESVGGEAAKNLTLYALWQKTDDLFTIYYDLNGGKTEGENPVSVGAGEMHKLYAAQKTGFDFIGWNTEKDGSGEYLGYLYGIDETLHLYAIFEEKEFLIRYIYEGTYEGMETNPNTVVYGEQVDLLPVYLYGYRFEGWFDAATGGNKIERIDETNILTLSALYAHFVPLTFTISLNAGGGVFTEGGKEVPGYDYVLSFGEEFTLPECVWDGYIFIEWVNEKGERVTEINVFNISDMQLTAVWRAEDQSYTITYVLDGGKMNVVNPETVICGEILPLYEPEREGYVFLGWYDNAQGQGKEYFFTPADQEEDLVLYAVWQIKKVNGSSEYFEYEIVGDSTVTITDYTGEDGENITINIPATIDGLPVTKLGWSYSSYSLLVFKSIILPEGLLSLGEGVFIGFNSIEPIVIPASVVEIGKNCFNQYKGEVYFAADSKIKEIGAQAFYGAEITNVLVLPSSVEVIGYRAFASSVLPGIILPDGLKTIYEHGLYSSEINCWRSIYIPSSVTYIGKEGVSAKDMGGIYTGLSEEQCKNFSSDWASAPSYVVYDWKPSPVTFCDGEKEETFTECIYSLPKPEKNGYTFLGWQTEDGTFADWLFVPTQNTVLNAVYEKKTSEDGRNVLTPAVYRTGGTKEFYVLNESCIYFRIDTDTPIEIYLETEIDKAGVAAGLFRQNEFGEFRRIYEWNFVYEPGEILKIQLLEGLNSYVIRLRLKIIFA